MKSFLIFIGSLAVIGLGAGATILADHFKALPGLESPKLKDSSSCPHTLAAKECPFCDKTLIEKEGECGEHGVPEALCYQCRPALIEGFKAANDWCAGHDVPESQCYDCNPDLLRKSPNNGIKTPAGILALIAREEEPRSLRSPVIGCRTHTSIVRFKSPELAAKVGLDYATTTLRKVTKTLSCNAEISYDGRRYARLSPRAPAIVSEIKKDLGEQVKKGDLIAVLHSVDLAVTKTDFLKHKENVNTTKLKLQQAKETFQRMNRLELRLAAVEYLKGRELQVVARRNVEREQRLLKTNATSEKELLAAQAAVYKADATVKAFSKTLQLFGLSAARLKTLDWNGIETLNGRGTTSAQPYLEAQIALKRAQSDLNSSRRRLQLLGLTAKDIVLVEEHADSSADLPLYAPFAGILVERRAVIGEVVKPGDLLFALADTSKMWAMIDIAEEDVTKVRKGQPVILQAHALRGLSFQGQITWVSTTFDDKTRVIKARAEFDNSKGHLRADMFVRAQVHLGGEKPSLIVPKSAVQWEGCCNIVFVKLSDDEFEPRKVQLAFETGDYAVIAEGLEEDEIVVTTGSFLLKTEIQKGNIGAGCCGD